MIDRDAKAKAIVVTGTTAAMAAAVIPIPVADAVAIASAQIAMLTAITALYGFKPDGTLLAGLVMVFGGAQAGIWFGSLLKGIPGLGTLAGSALQMTIAGTVTAAMGLGMNTLLKTGRPINPENFRRAADEAKEEASRLAQEQRAVAEAEALRSAALRAKVRLAAVVRAPGVIEVTFDLSGLPPSTLRLTDEKGNELLTAKVSAADSPYSLRSSALAGGRTYVVALQQQGTTIPVTVRT